jgi:hypothetical protein
MLHNVFFIKAMFDETHDGAGTLGSPYPGTTASAQFVFENTSSNEASVPVGQYTFTDGVKNWVVPVDVLLTVPGNDTAPAITGYADSVGNNVALTAGVVTSNSITPALPSGITLSAASVTQGTNPAPGPLIPSKYFDLVLALAYQCKLDIKQSWLLSLVKVSYLTGDQTPPTPVGYGTEPGLNSLRPCKALPITTGQSIFGRPSILWSVKIPPC